MGKPSILATEQLDTLASLTKISSEGDLYLAGGSAVAFHLQHRRSHDLDLFSFSADFDLADLQHKLTKSSLDIEILSANDTCLRCRIGQGAVDVVRYPYALLEPVSPGPKNFPVAHLLDLAPMKLAAIARRGIRRDFWDLHEIVTRSPISLEDSLNAYLRKFHQKEADLYHVLRALTYFEDAEKDQVYPEALTLEHWNHIKDYFRTHGPRMLQNINLA